MLENRYKIKSLELSFIKKQRMLRIAPIFAFLVLFTIMILTVSPITNSTNITRANSTAVASNLNFYSIRDSVTLEVTPSNPNGNFVASTSENDISFGITTDNYTGYTLMAKTTDSALRSSGGGTILALSSAVSPADFGSDSSAALNNRWGYQPNKLNSADNTNYLAPSTTAVVLDQTTAANISLREYRIGFGLRVDATTPAGEYLNETFVLEYVANPAPYVVNFLSGTADDIVTGLPQSFSGEAVSAESIPLPEDTPERDNYSFIGWCTIMPHAEPGGDGCKGRQLDPGMDYGIDYTKDSSVINLYAMWHSNYGCNKAARTIGRNVSSTDAVCMQDINETVINSMTVGTQYSLIDFRDGKTYFVSKLNDGKVWMTQNLDFDLNSSKVYTHNNTDLGYTTNNLSSTWQPSRNTTNTIDDWSSDGTTARSYNAGEKYYYPVASPASNDDVSTTCNNVSTCKHYHAGNYYNFAAMAAEHITGADNQYAKMSDSVCPAGWRLPDGPSEYIYDELNNMLVLQNLVTEYSNQMGVLGYETDGFDNLKLAPTYLATTGAVNGYEVYTSYDALLPTNTIYNSGNVFMNTIDSTGFGVAQYITKAYGLPVRCVARAGGAVTVNFNGNGATSGSKSPIVAKNGDAVKLENPFDKEHYSFVEWNTKDDGTGTSYDEEGVMVISMSEESTVNLYAIWRAEMVEIECPGGYICYGSTFDDVAGTMNDGTYNLDTTSNIGYQSASDNTDITLMASNYRRNGYGFAGWNTEVDGTGTYYGPNQTITAPNDVSVNGLKLYAMWLAPAGTLQDWGGCNSLTAVTYDSANGVIAAGSSSITALTDTRDGEVYAVARLADGNCWMVENLRLGVNGSSDSIKSQGFGGVFTGLASSESSGFSSSATSGNGKYASWDVGNENTWYRIPRQNNSNVTSLAGTYASNANLYSYGTYYTWSAAIADTTNHTSYNDHVSSLTSICPSGWHLPNGAIYNKTGSYYYLAASMEATASSLASGNKFRSFPNNFVYSGNFDNNAATLRGEAGAYWTGTVNNSGSAFNLGFTASGSLSVENAAIKAIGLSVRCVLGEVTEDTSIGDLEYMQDFVDLTNEEKQGVIDLMTTGEIYELKDSRDEKVYSVAKLTDGNIWMVENLDHDIVTTANFYTHDNTDLGYEPGSSTTFTPTNASIAYTNLSGNTVTGWGTGANDASSFNIGSEGGYGNFGNYYSFAAATAMDADSGYGSSDSTYVAVANSICPAGWRLPDYSNDEFGTINTYYNFGASNGDSGLVASPLYYMHISMINNGELDQNAFGSGGGYWYNTANDTDGYIFSYGTNNAGASNVARSTGASVRCILRQ